MSIGTGERDKLRWAYFQFGCQVFARFRPLHQQGIKDQTPVSRALKIFLWYCNKWGAETVSALFDELLNAPSGSHFGGVDVASGIHCNFVQEDKLAGVTSDPAKAPYLR